MLCLLKIAVDILARVLVVQELLMESRQYQGWTKSGTKSGTQGYKFSGQRDIEDHEIIPGNILSQDKGF